MSSGVSVQDDVKHTYADLKKNHKFRYVVYALTDDLKEIMVKSTGAPDANYEEFLDQMKEAETANQCRYAVYDAQYLTTATQTQKNKLVLYLWSPETATIKQKMLYSSSMQALKVALGDGIAHVIQAHDYGDLEWANVIAEISRLDRN